MEENKMAKGLMIGFLAGSAIGAGIALLYAPKSGKELRADIKQKKDEMIDDASEYWEVTRTKANDYMNEAKVKAQDVISQAKQRASSLIDDANNILSEAKQKAAVTLESTKEKITSETQHLKDAVKAGVDAYKTEKTKQQQA
jgi:gas vesicle protein